MRRKSHSFFRFFLFRDQSHNNLIQISKTKLNVLRNDRHSVDSKTYRHRVINHQNSVKRECFPGRL
jgi:hypothetical protein